MDYSKSIDNVSVSDEMGKEFSMCNAYYLS